MAHQDLLTGTSHLSERTDTSLWDAARADLAGLPDGRGLNIAYEAVDRHVAEGRAGTVALRCLALDGRSADVTYGELAERSARVANALTDLGVTPGDTVFLLLGRTADLYAAAHGALKTRASVCTLFAAFGPEPIRARLELGRARVVVTTPALYDRKLAGVLDALDHLDHVLLTGPDDGRERPRTRWLEPLLAAAEPTYVVGPTDPETPSFLHFTSGTTGRPKGAVHVHGGVVAHLATARLVLDLRPGDVYWCTADPGWVTGTSYGLVAPLVVGATCVVDEAEFDASRWYGVLEREGVTVWYTAPTAIRRLMRAGAELAQKFDTSRLRLVASVGEPLNAEAVRWGEQALRRTIRDSWWQTETGAIMIANYAADAVAGSLGRPVPGITAAVLVSDEQGEALRPGGHVQVRTEPDVPGELALRRGWPSMFRTYLDDPERYAAAFVDGWYLTGDVVKQDAEGRLWFMGRADDVIKSSGHLIGPFEVESLLMEHPAVVEAGVIGRPDPVAGEVVKAFVVLGSGVEPSDALRLDIVGFARKRLGAAVAPKEIDIVDDLPKTRSGKIMRRLLRARELGLAEGDTSTLETVESR
ncbi:acetate--CoA ligase [Angustibacter sp. Root456]|uniref:acetate--CoA ligase n=1 Tax=Angustibacter sp. Root456 TaxID=1736539 RepID=UPI0006F59A7C|nr:acetate--CoA ligase [Angustibacter sp. Root456]KQX61929.1 acetyl-CoA synthetase [Angustibacter sp. Root456]